MQGHAGKGESDHSRYENSAKLSSTLESHYVSQVVSIGRVYDTRPFFLPVTLRWLDLISNSCFSEVSFVIVEVVRYSELLDVVLTTKAPAVP